MWLVSFMAIIFGSVVACIPVALHTLLGIPMPSGERYTLPESIFDNFALLFQQGKEHILMLLSNGDLEKFVVRKSQGHYIPSEGS